MAWQGGLAKVTVLARMTIGLCGKRYHLFW